MTADNSSWLADIKAAMNRAKASGVTDDEQELFGNLQDLYHNLLLIIEEYHKCGRRENRLTSRDVIEITAGVLGRLIQEHSADLSDILNNVVKITNEVLQSAQSTHEPRRKR